jgi:hypothetical protein
LIEEEEKDSKEDSEKRKEKGGSSRALFQSQGPFVQLQLLRDSN